MSAQTCRACGGPNENGEGWDGECGNCADRTEQASTRAKPKCFRHRIVVEVLTMGDQPYEFSDLDQLRYDITEGHAIGDIKEDGSDEVSLVEFKTLVDEARSDMGFFAIELEAFPKADLEAAGLAEFAQSEDEA